MDCRVATQVVVVAFSSLALLGGAIAQQTQPGGGSQGQGATGSPSQGQGSQGQGSQGQGQSSQGQGSQGQGGQGPSGGTSGGSSSTGATAKDAPVVGRIPLGVKVEETDLVAKGWRASKLVRADVYNDKNQKIGKIEDMVISPDGKVSVAIVDVGGFLGIKSHRVAIPVDQLKFEDQKKVLLPGATKEALKDLPEFQYVKA